MKQISVITINYNNAKGLKKTLESLAAQDTRDFECVVVDGGSSDESVEVIEKFSEIVGSWVSEKDKGIYNAQNKGISMAKGQYFLFLNSGDVLADSSVLKEILPELNNVGILYGDIITLASDGKKTELQSPENVGVYEMMVSTLWHPSAFIKKEIFDTIGGYNEEFRIAADYEFFIRAILKHNVSTQHVKRAIAIFDLSGVSNNDAMNNLQTAERKQSWKLNFSDAVIESFEEYTRLLRSGELKLGRAIKNIVKPFSGKK